MEAVLFVIFFLTIGSSCSENGSRHCMEITCQNYRKEFAHIETIIKNASFVAFDLEFLGLEDEERSMRCSLFDSAQERYAKTKFAVKRFPPAQLGLALFTSLDEGKRYKVDVFTIYLFKASNVDANFSFSISSLDFLKGHGFDFNKLVKTGVPHMNLDELERVMAQFHEPGGIEVFGKTLSKLFYRLQRIIRSEVAKARRKSTGSEGAEQFSFPGIPIAITEKLSELERNVLLYKLYSCTPGVRFEIKGNVLTVHSSDPVPRETRKMLFNNITRDLVGASDIIHAIIDSRLPMVGHNAFRDLMYIYEYFIADLPGTLEEFKKSLHFLFPVIFDTKILAEESKDRLSQHGVMSYRLECLNAFFERMRANKQIPTPIYDYQKGLAEKFDILDPSSMHDAGVDSVSTGQTFLRLAHFISNQTFGLKACILFKKLMYCTRPLANRLPVPLLGVPYLNLLGAEPPSRNPEAIILEMIVQEDTARLGALRKELRWKFGRWRFDIRKHEDNRIQVATNSENTYWRILNYYATHPDYRVLLSSEESSVESSSFADSPLSSPPRVLTPDPKIPMCLTELAFDVSFYSPVKWMLGACSLVVATQFIMYKARH